MAHAEAGRLAELYAAHGRAVVRLASLMTGDRGLAEDLAHEAFIRMFGRFRDLRKPEAFEWYLRKTIVNLARSHVRRRRVEQAYLEREGRRPAAAGTRPRRAGGDLAGAPAPEPPGFYEKPGVGRYSGFEVAHSEEAAGGARSSRSG